MFQVLINKDGSKLLYSIKPTLPIGQYVRDTFGSTYFAFMPPIRILQENATCISEGFNESRDFSVKSRMVTICKLTGENKVNVTECKTIADVARKVNAQSLLLNNTELDKSVSLDEVIMKEEGECRFVIGQTSEPAMFTIDRSVSAAADNSDTNSIMNKTLTYEIYSHHLALRLYDAWSGAKTQYNIEKIIGNFQSILSHTYTDGEYFDYKKTYTAFLSMELGHFLTCHCCLHQPSLRHKMTRSVGESVPDFCICRHSVTTPIVVADFKRRDDNFNKAKSHSFGYAQGVMMYSKSRNPIVAMPGTSERFALYLCFTINYDFNAKLVTIKIGEAKVDRV